jgi:hypothetical protein
VLFSCKKEGEWMRQKITVTRGRSETIRVIVPDANGNPYVMSEGETLLFGVKKADASGDLLILKTVTECTDGVATFQLIPEDTIDLEYGRYAYDVSLKSGVDLFDVVKAAPFVIEPNVTKWGEWS